MAGFQMYNRHGSLTERERALGCGQPSVTSRCTRRRTFVSIASAASSATDGQVLTAEALIASDDKPAGQCPFSALTSSIAGIAQASPSGIIDDRPGVAPPGPAAFSLASALDVSKILTDGLHGAMLHFASKYGSVCRFQNPTDLNGASGWLFLNSPENIQHVCQDNVRNYINRYLPDVYEFATHGKGILGSQGEYNMRHRRLCQPPFRNRSLLKQFSNIVVERATMVGDIFAAQQAGFTTDIALQTQRLTLDVVGLVAFTHDFSQVRQIERELQGQKHSGSDDRLLWAVNTFGEILAQVFITPLPLLKALHAVGFPQLRRLDEAISVMKAAMLEVIEKRRRQLHDGERPHDDLLAALLDARDDDGAALSNDELWEDVHDIMGAGHETTATTTAALIYCISTHPDVERKVVDELRRVCGDRPPCFDDLEQLTYLNACVKEVLRLYPAIPVFPREAAAADVLPSGHRVECGDVVFMSSYALGRSGELWEDPLEFRPDRFGGGAVVHKFQWLPFGAGPRMCLGASWAQMSVALMAATLLQRFAFDPVFPSSPLIPVDYDITMNFNRTRGLHMRIAPRLD